MENKTVVGICILLGFIGLVGLVSGDYYRVYKIEEELKTKGINTKGWVVERWETTGGKNSYAGWNVRCEFQANNAPYSTFDQQDENNEFSVGDTVHIVYIGRNPEISRVNEFE